MCKTESRTGNISGPKINGLLEKGTIQKAIYQKNQFVSHLFLVSQKDDGQMLVINLKKLKQFISYRIFQMERLYLLKEILEEGDYLCMLVLKDDYFCGVPFNKDIQNLWGLNEKAQLTSFFTFVLGRTQHQNFSQNFWKSQ